MKLFHTLIFIAFLSNAFCQNFSSSTIPKASFKESAYFVNEGESFQLCVDLENFPNSYKGKLSIESKNQQAEFLSLESQEVTLINGEICYNFNTNTPNGYTNQFNNQTLELVFDIPEDSTVIISPHFETNIYLKDDTPLLSDPSVPLFIFKGLDDEVENDFVSLLFLLNLLNQGLNSK